MEQPGGSWGTDHQRRDLLDRDPFAERERHPSVPDRNGRSFRDQFVEHPHLAAGLLEHRLPLPGRTSFSVRLRGHELHADSSGEPRHDFLCRSGRGNGSCSRPGFGCERRRWLVALLRHFGQLVVVGCAVERERSSDAAGRPLARRSRGRNVHGPCHGQLAGSDGIARNRHRDAPGLPAHAAFPPRLASDRARFQPIRECRRRDGDRPGQRLDTSAIVVDDRRRQGDGPASLPQTGDRGRPGPRRRDRGNFGQFGLRPRCGHGRHPLAEELRSAGKQSGNPRRIRGHRDARNRQAQRPHLRGGR